MSSFDLPKTFQDAISLVSRLGLEYIWIDSLCILQDSLDDWDREAAVMSDVYLNATINIAATAASDGREGLFNDRDSLKTAPFQVYVDWQGNWYGGPKRPYRGWYYLALTQAFEIDVRSAPLNTRGWIYWECMQLTSNEAFPEGFLQNDQWIASIGPRTIWSSDKIQNICQKPAPTTKEVSQPGSIAGKLITRPGPESEEKREHDQWRRYVADYTKCALTKQTDKLIAIGGIASALAPWLKDENIAGCWRGSIFEDLLWKRAFRTDTLGSKSLSLDYMAPSWSWASVDGAVEYDSFSSDSFEPKQYHCTLVEVTVLRLASSVVGDIGDDFIRIRGPLRVTTIEALGSFDVRSRLWGLAISWDRSSHDLGQPHRRFTLMTRKGAIHAQESEIFMLPTLNAPDTLTGLDKMQGILLIRAQGGKGQFFRVGHFETDDPKKQQAVLASKVPSLDKFAEAVHEDGSYTIRIL
ncbi:unnamed protein product [Clonostachys solani]|uniref:Heterokaryon incompatibility domain-containing protein n=1 Tax=Clonostachys solani TaxID=160281 RepID=A0A9P0ERW8_9HYPO|nr:unnamed protein product [Clonostachys solani]